MLSAPEVRQQTLCNMRRLVKQLAVVVVILVILALLTHVIAERRTFYQLASVVAIALAFVTGVKLVLDFVHAIVAWAAACTVVPLFLLLLGKV